jgi:DNA-binding transcriptional ArsR family regulator
VNSEQARPGRERSRLRVLAHPLRLQMLSLLTASPLSAMELSRELGVSQALASYHLRQLHAAGVTELAEVRPRRGGRERRYIYRPEPDVPAAQRGGREDQALFAEAIEVELRRRVREADGGAARLGVDAELWVDPDAWQSALDGVRAATGELHRQARPPRTPGTVRVSVSALLFTMSTEPAADADGHSGADGDSGADHG